MNDFDESRVAAGEEDRRISTGSEGLDDILGGGLDPNRMYLYEGSPGSGKTTIALQFLLEGVRHGERVLYVTLSETKRELELVAKRHGWTHAFLELDPRRHIYHYFEPGDRRGPLGFLHAHGLPPPRYGKEEDLDALRRRLSDDKRLPQRCSDSQARFSSRASAIVAHPRNARLLYL